MANNHGWKIMTKYTDSYYPSECHWVSHLYKDGRHVATRQLTGFGAGPRMWFKPLEERAHLAAAELMRVAGALDSTDAVKREVQLRVDLIAQAWNELAADRRSGSHVNTDSNNRR